MQSVWKTDYQKVLEVIVPENSPKSSQLALFRAVSSVEIMKAAHSEVRITLCFRARVHPVGSFSPFSLQTCQIQQRGQTGPTRLSLTLWATPPASLLVCTEASCSPLSTTSSCVHVSVSYFRTRAIKNLND